MGFSIFLLLQVVVLGDISPNGSFMALETLTEAVIGTHLAYDGKAKRLVVPLCNLNAVVDRMEAINVEAMRVGGRQQQQATAQDMVEIVGVRTIWDAILVVFPHYQRSLSGAANNFDCAIRRGPASSIASDRMIGSLQAALALLVSGAEMAMPQ